MQVTIVRVEGGYLATVSPSDGDAVRWATEEPLSQRTMINNLAELGFHQQDIGDAFYEADAEWQFRTENE